MNSDIIVGADLRVSCSRSELAEKLGVVARARAGEPAAHVAVVRDGTAAYSHEEHDMTVRNIDRFFGEEPLVAVEVAVDDRVGRAVTSARGPLKIEVDGLQIGDALVVDGGPGTGKTVVALHRAAYLFYSDPRLGHRRGGVLFVGPHQPYLAYVADVLGPVTNGTSMRCF